MNSDPHLVRLMIRWMKEIGRINDRDIKARLYLHKIYAHENCENFWVHETGIERDKFLNTIYKPTPHKVKKNPDYKGCLRIEVSGSELYWKVMKWRDIIYQDL